ncbi:MAG: glycerophosphodiester phosphodiesterase family protein [Jatrophihabitans sp.]|uniref:glycerophosphodiester phosphodiesterase family protein n=1 Tax=Jatrophihabitans sp. TaxID=1932789 RepID=UPI003F7F51AA
MIVATAHRFPFLDAPRPIAFAHRGFAPDGAENSMAAFERAVALGYRYLETDVRVTADGVALAFHDASLDRVTDRRGRIDRLPWAEVRRARIAGREPIPRLDDLLAAWQDVRINLDLKAAHSIGATLDVLRATRALDRVCVNAFADRRIATARAAFGPRLCTGLGPREAVLLRRGHPGPYAGRCAQLPARLGRLAVVDERLVATAHAAGLDVHVWTVNDRAEMQRLLDLGVDGLMTDAADVLRDVLVERGHWPVGG